MSSPAPLHPSQQMLLRETKLEHGPVPEELDGVPVPPGQHRMAGGAFLLHAESGVRFLYRRGAGHVLCEAADSIDPAELALWHNGSVYAAVAALNGLRPFHASAIAHAGLVIAFTAPGGGGKSTIAAALAARGFALFADDTLVLDLGDPDHPVCLPGHKRLKLTAEALALTGLERQEQVAPDYPKHYALPPRAEPLGVLPLARLVFLEYAEQPELIGLSGAERFARLQDTHDTDAFWRTAQGADRAGLFAAQAGLARSTAMWRLRRPRNLAQFGASLDLAESVVDQLTGAAR